MREFFVDAVVPVSLVIITRPNGALAPVLQLGPINDPQSPFTYSVSISFDVLNFHVTPRLVPRENYDHSLITINNKKLSGLVRKSALSVNF